MQYINVLVTEKKTIQGQGGEREFVRKLSHFREREKESDTLLFQLIHSAKQVKVTIHTSLHYHNLQIMNLVWKFYPF